LSITKSPSGANRSCCIRKTCECASRRPAPSFVRLLVKLKVGSDSEAVPVNDKPLNENIAQLMEDIAEYRVQSKHWWKYNHAMRNLLITSSFLASAGATIAGIWTHPHVSATFAACGAGIIGLQGSLKYAEKAHDYGLALTECDRLSNKLQFQIKTPSDFDSVLEAYHNLRGQEGGESERAPRPVAHSRSR
jgi:hypothetical protein